MYIKKLNRLLEDIFSPMSDPEQAEVDKVMEDAYLIQARLHAMPDTKIFKEMEVFLSSLGFFDMELDTCDSTDWESKSKVDKLDNVVSLIEKKFKELGIKTITTKNRSDVPEWDEVKIYKDLTNPEYELLSKIVTRRAILVHMISKKIRMKKELRLAEDIFRPMSGPEQADVNKLFKMILTARVDNFTGWKQMAEIDKKLVEIGFKRFKSKYIGNDDSTLYRKDIKYTEDPNILSDIRFAHAVTIKKWFKKTPTLSRDYIASSSPGLGQRVVEFDEPGTLMPRRIIITTQRNKKGIRLEEDLFSPMRGEELEDVKKHSEEKLYSGLSEEFKSAKTVSLKNILKSIIVPRAEISMPGRRNIGSMRAEIKEEFTKVYTRIEQYLGPVVKVMLPPEPYGDIVNDIEDFEPKEYEGEFGVKDAVFMKLEIIKIKGRHVAMFTMIDERYKWQQTEVTIYGNFI